MIGIYNFYDPDIQSGLLPEAQRKGIVGWTGENKIRGGVAPGKPIYLGFENNQHLSPEEHSLAAHSLNQRSQRMKEMVNQGQIHRKDLDAVNNEIGAIEAQRDLHTRRHVQAKEPVGVSPVTKSEGSSPLVEVLQRLILAIRQK